MSIKSFPKILIVDDKSGNLLALEKVLNELDIGVIRASSGKESLALTLRHDFFVVLMDINMPEMDGFETVALLKSHDKTMLLPVIFITAYGNDELKQLETYSVGAVDYITKPINSNILLGKVRVFLQLYLQSIEIDEKYQEMVLLQKSLQHKNNELEKLNQEFSRSNDELEQFPMRFHMTYKNHYAQSPAI